MTPTTMDAGLSAECTLARRQGYQDLHRECRQIRDVPLPHSAGLLLVRRCLCTCHRPVAGGER